MLGRSDGAKCGPPWGLGSCELPANARDPKERDHGYQTLCDSNSPQGGRGEAVDRNDSKFATLSYHPIPSSKVERTMVWTNSTTLIWM